MKIGPNTSEVYRVIETLNRTASFSVSGFGGIEIIMVPLDAQHGGRQTNRGEIQDGIHDQIDLEFEEDEDME
jgi:hypothetical protein